jgi:hypothetical protein
LTQTSPSTNAQTVIVRTTNTGSYNWTIPSTLNGGNVYKALVYINDTAASGMSGNYFSITSGASPSPIAGACAVSGTVTSLPTANLCSAGTVDDVQAPTANNSRWNWTCNGLNNGATANCSVLVSTPINGACGTFPSVLTSMPTTGLCVTTGGNTNLIQTATGWSWYCNGINNGAQSPLCSALVIYKK